MQPRMVSQSLVEKIPLSSDSCVVDLGCGTGLFTLELAMLLGDQARVFGVDQSVECVRQFQKDLKSDLYSKLSNIEVVHCPDLEGGEIDIPPTGVHLALMCDLAPYIKKREAFYTSIRKRLADNGVVVILESYESQDELQEDCYHAGLTRCLELEVKLRKHLVMVFKLAEPGKQHEEFVPKGKSSRTIINKDAVKDDAKDQKKMDPKVKEAKRLKRRRCFAVIRSWLKRIDLEDQMEAFLKTGFTDVDKLKKGLDDEDLDDLEIDDEEVREKLKTNTVIEADFPDASELKSLTPAERIKAQKKAAAATKKAGKAAGNVKPKVKSKEALLREWLSGMRLEHLAKVFMEKEYTDVKVMSQMGLDDDDLDYLEITDAKERSTLKKGALGAPVPSKAAAAKPTVTPEEAAVRQWLSAKSLGHLTQTFMEKE